MEHVTQEVFEQYREVQHSGDVNMVRKTAVQRAAADRGLHDLVVFIDDGDYFDLLDNFAEYREKYEVRGGQ